ncbi:DUF3806 domain-containing protein [Gilvimarinus sp. SDUM040013]|uniref:DUF3806 domain-containing protein n=1 Tax=Gilvimarinus gilvus TaxID=3058038 RepID=A0ABU4S0I3_9GAMM|nr:DUF3806 domain-containing protein [Gilvimarinus sp. SDUM040013]MDO3385773.1 DUF3806 domain-containing protein [Gilvimarinus sp. SDUM040013]MDX6850665.1 DUF3806 domain-containing protein [Gilvimarinus sp. SDUM040013]
MNRYMTTALLALVLLPSILSAQPPQGASPIIRDLSWTDESFLNTQRKRITRIASEQIGVPIRGTSEDLATLQRIIDRELISQDDISMQQALGVVMGDAMLAAESQLRWKVYEDNRGNSRALCAASVNECLFPVTMLSRRMRVGLKPDVKKIYLDALYLIAEDLPQLPYGGKREYSIY